MTDAIHSIDEQMTFDLYEPSDNAQVVYSARKILAGMNFGETAQYLIASAVSELSTNIIRYAQKGKITLSVIHRGDKTGFEVNAQDQGPGIADMDIAMKENYSSGNGLGLGLPSVKRIMDEFQIQSTPGVGTRITAIKWMD
ncbi:anti-sigma regulatory factor [Desulfobacter curvatus]|uniref:anti-sigma regulatory factor n=1 Tax=Desulfobacter curvatus TaxID=2290 RepID=UPI00036B9CBD|nr:anti-sigma regulatory factor [Desulfobacter curvatus]